MPCVLGLFVTVGQICVHYCFTGYCPPRISSRRHDSVLGRNQSDSTVGLRYSLTTFDLRTTGLYWTGFVLATSGCQLYSLPRTVSAIATNVSESSVGLPTPTCQSLSSSLSEVFCLGLGLHPAIADFTSSALGESGDSGDSGDLEAMPSPGRPSASRTTSGTFTSNSASTPALSFTVSPPQGGLPERSVNRSCLTAGVPITRRHLDDKPRDGSASTLAAHVR